MTTLPSGRTMTAIATGCDWRSSWSASQPMVNRMLPPWAIKGQNGECNGASGRYWLTPPDLKGMIKQEFGEYWDACPYPLPAGHDALAMDWPEDERVIYVNAPFTKRDELHGRGLIEFARKAIAEHRKGKTVIMAVPTTDTANLLLAEGAEVWPLGRCAWIGADTGKPWPSPGASALFILRAKRRR
jgi:hypothetical protein